MYSELNTAGVCPLPKPMYGQSMSVANHDPYEEMARGLRGLAEHSHDGLVNGVVAVAQKSKDILIDSLRSIEFDIKECQEIIQSQGNRIEEKKKEAEFVRNQIQRLEKLS